MNEKKCTEKEHILNWQSLHKCLDSVHDLSASFLCIYVFYIEILEREQGGDIDTIEITFHLTTVFGAPDTSLQNEINLNKT